MRQYFESRSVDASRLIGILFLASACAVLIAPTVARSQSEHVNSEFSEMHWRNISPTQGGRASAAVGVPSSPEIYYMGTAGGGLWKTESSGQEWENVSDGFFNTESIGDIAVYRDDPSILIVGTGEASARGEMSTFGDGVYKTTDAGDTWTHLGLTNTKQISRVLIHPSDSRIVYVAAQGDQWGPNEERGVFRSVDGGTTWERILFVSDLAGASDVQMDPSNPKTLYAAMWDRDRGHNEFRTVGPGSGLWKSSDGGDSWKQLQDGLPDEMGKIRLAISPNNPSIVYANIEARGGAGGLYRSEDGGKTWAQKNASRTLTARAWYYMDVTVDPNDADIVYVMNVPLFKSEDAGENFVPIDTPHDDTHTLWINPSNSRNMVLTHDGGTSVTFDGGVSWTDTDNQPTGQFYSLQVDDLFPYNLYGGQQDQTSVRVASRRLTGDGRGQPAFWRSVGGGETARMAFDPADPGIVLTSNYFGLIEAFDTNTGVTRMVSQWPEEPFGKNSETRKYSFNWSAALSMSPNGRRIYHAGTVVFRTTDFGYNWTKISPVLTHGRETIYDVVESPRESRTIWVGTDEGRVHRTRNGGKSWQNVTPDDGIEGVITSIEASPHDKATAYVVLSRMRWHDYVPYVSKTTDNGKTWTNIAGGLPQNFPARVVREDPKRRDLLYAGTENGIWVSFDGGSSWRTLQGNLPHSPISDMRIRHDDLIVSTEGRAFWILEDLTPLHQWSPDANAQTLTLFKPRPSFRLVNSGRRGGERGESPGVANIWYSLSKASNDTNSLTLEIRDSNGKLIRTVTTDEPDLAPLGPPGGVSSDADSIPVPSLTTHAGLNRYPWNFRTAPREGAVGPGGAPFAGGRPPPMGYVVPSGTFEIRMQLGDATVSQSLQVLRDPRVSSSIADEREHTNMARAITERSVEINSMIESLRDAKSQAAALTESGDNTVPEIVEQAIQSFVDSANSIEQLLQQNRGGIGIGSQDFLRYLPGLITEYSYLLGLVDGSSGPLTVPEKERFADLETQWEVLRTRGETVLTTELQELNALILKNGISQQIQIAQSQI